MSRRVCEQSDVLRSSESATSYIRSRIEAARRTQGIFTELFEAEALWAARMLDDQADPPRCDGLSPALSVSIKDVFRVKGHIAHAGSHVFDDDAPAMRDAPVIAKLRRSGAVLLGYTTMSAFGQSSLGINEVFGTPKNPFDADRIPGGSSSGISVATALDITTAGLGTDTGGSVRIPSAFCGLVGYKPSRKRFSLMGVIPVARSMEAVGVVARTVETCITMDTALTGGLDTNFIACSQTQALRFAIPETYVVRHCDEAVWQSFRHAVSVLRDAGAQISYVPSNLFDEVDAVEPLSIIPAFEIYAWHRRLLETRGHLYEPAVRDLIESGRTIASREYARMQAWRKQFKSALEALIRHHGTLLTPAVCLLPPFRHEVEDAEAAMKLNRRMLTFTMFANLADSSSLTLPWQTNLASLPIGLMLTGCCDQDQRILDEGLAVQHIIRQVTGHDTGQENSATLSVQR